MSSGCQWSAPSCVGGMFGVPSSWSCSPSRRRGAARAARSTDWSPQPCHGAHVDPLARAARPGVLAAGNLFCAGCPMVLVRDAGRRLVPPRFSFPHQLRRKWIAAGLLVLVLFLYELFACGSGRPRPRGSSWATSCSRWSWICCSRARRSASTSARSVSSTSWHRRCAGGAEGPRLRDVPRVPDLRLHQGAEERRATRCRSYSEAASSACSCQARSATWIARSASTVCMPARTTTSGW